MKLFTLYFLFVISLFFWTTQSHSFALTENTQTQRIISLAPHLAEIVYILNKGNELIAVSEASNFPEDVKGLPTVANYRGLNFTAILRARPTHILAWQNGNKSKDIQKLEAMGLSVLTVSINSLDDITRQIMEVGAYINAPNTQVVADKFANALHAHQHKYEEKTPQTVFYYSTQQPLFTIGQEAWVTQLLATCQLQSIYKDSAIPYPQANLTFVLEQQPDVIISTQKQPLVAFERFWQTYQNILNPTLIQADPDKMHRFTPRVLDELERICATAHM
jgi:vitamin B12 transport system substrate-binding protein